MSDSTHPTAAPPAPANDQYDPDEAALDPEIAALLTFEPVPRARVVEGSWTPELQREFIARLAVHGSSNKACDELGKNRTGMNRLYNNPRGASFRAAWDGAVELSRRREAERAPMDFVSPGTKPPTVDHRRKKPVRAAGEQGLPGQVLNEYGEWEDEDSFQRRGEEARDSISNKLRRARRLYLREISGCPGKRAAFEMLTELPIDWDKAERLEPQPDEPWRRPNMREGDMLLTAENGWIGEVAHGPDKTAELRKTIDEYRAEEGLEPVDWEGE